MKTKTILNCLVAVFATGAAAGGTVSVSGTAPVVDGSDLANDSGNADAGGDQGHMWSNRPHQGQTFVTGANDAGYQLNAVTLKNRNNTITNSPTFNVVVGSVSGTTMTQVGTTETGTAPNYSPGDYLTFTFDTPLTLDASTEYGFLWGSAGSGFVTANNLDGNTYAGGTAISSGDDNNPDLDNLLDRGVDRVFHLDLTALVGADDDGDGLPNKWETDNSLNPNEDGTLGESQPGLKDGPNGALGDPDMDGSTNANEFAKDTDPQDNDSDDDLLFDGVETGTGIYVDEMNTGSDPLEKFTDADSLDDGEEVNGTRNGNFGSEPTDPNNPDSDGDTLDDGEETSAGTDGVITNPNEPDTDGDALTDDIDITPLVADLDPDSDGLENADELDGALNPFGDPTDPQDSDTDGDGIDDGDELDAGTGEANITNPAAADTDGDGLDDDVEFAGTTDPTNPDTDGDGFDDGTELAGGSDPNDPNSRPDAVFMSVSDVAPLVDGADIASLSGLIDIGGDQGHVWNNRSRQGQSFTTGSDSGSYQLHAVTVRVRVDQGSTLSPSWELRIGTLDGSEIFTELATYSFAGVTIPQSIPGNNFPSHVTWTFGVPVPLAPNTTYGFDVYAAGSGYISLGESTDVYPGGSAYSAGSPGSTLYPASPPDPVTSHGNDRHFHLDITGGGPSIRIIDFEVFEDVGGESIRLAWESEVGREYAIDSSIDLLDWSTEVATDIEALAETTSFVELIANLPQTGPEVYFRVRELIPPPPLSADFENGPAGWTAGFDGEAATQWELGAPMTVGPATGNNSANCWGTNRTADYKDDANCWLRSPDIDLTGAESATLSWSQWVDIDDFDSVFDFGTVRIFNAADDMELGVIEGPINGYEPTWERIPRPIPDNALGKIVYLEFRFVSDDNTVVFPGWYIDNVEVTVP